MLDLVKLEGAKKPAARDDIERRLDRMHEDARAVFAHLAVTENGFAYSDDARRAWDAAEAMEAERNKRRAAMEAAL